MIVSTEPICVALALHDSSGSYSRHAGALIASVLDNTSAGKGIFSN